MLVTGWVPSRIGAKRTPISGLEFIVLSAALVGSSNSISGIAGFRGSGPGGGLGNVLSDPHHLRADRDVTAFLREPSTATTETRSERWYGDEGDRAHRVRRP